LTTVPHTPQLNGRAERLNRTLMEKVRALLFDAGVKKELWGEALYTATYILNRSPTYSLKKTPYEMCEKRKPNLLNLQIFGCEAFAKVLSHCPPSGRAVILNRITTLYFKNVANNPEIIKQWKKLNSEFGTSSGFWTIFYLQIFRFFRIHPNGKKLNFARRFYLTIHLCKIHIQQKAKYVYKNLSK